ncbi:MAG: hypothetical protein ACR2NA_12870 [Solirubrobacterales bacterium]
MDLFGGVLRGRRRAAMFAGVALAVPLPAFAGGGAGGLGASAILNGCSAGNAGIDCSVNVSYNRLADADSYTARVVKPDGSVQEFGTIGSSGAGPGAATLSFAYSGRGTYRIIVSAWSTTSETPEIVEEDDADAKPTPAGTDGKASGDEDPDTSDGAGKADKADSEDEKSEEDSKEPADEDPATQGGDPGTSVEEQPAAADTEDTVDCQDPAVRLEKRTAAGCTPLPSDDQSAASSPEPASEASGVRTTPAPAPVP